MYIHTVHRKVQSRSLQGILLKINSTVQEFKKYSPGVNILQSRSSQISVQEFTKVQSRSSESTVQEFTIFSPGVNILQSRSSQNIVQHNTKIIPKIKNTVQELTIFSPGVQKCIPEA
jgi:hypothetical protein